MNKSVARKNSSSSARPVAFSLRLYGHVRKDAGPNATDYFISHCPPLDVFSQGRTRKEAFDNLIDACALTVEYCLEHNTLDAVLRDCGFIPSPNRAKQAVPPLPRGARSFEIIIPMKVKSNGRRAKCPA